MSTRTYLGMGLLYCATTVAGSMDPLDNSSTNNGFYVGGSVGIANLFDKQATPDSNGHLNTRRFGAIGFVGGALIGYDFCFIERLQLGLEGFLNDAELNLAVKQIFPPPSSFNAHLRYNAGLRLLPGYELSPGTVGHVLLGFSYGQFKIDDDGDFGFINTEIPRHGFQVGLGLRLPCFTNNLSFRGDIIYTTYSANTSFGLTSTLDAPQPYYNTFATLEGDLALIYTFS